MEHIILVFILAALAILAAVLLIWNSLSKELRIQRQENESRALNQQHMTNEAITSGLRSVAEAHKGDLEALSRETARLLEAYRQTMQASGENVDKRIEQLRLSQETRLANLGEALDQRLEKTSENMDRRLLAMQQDTDKRLSAMQQDNEKKLEEMRATVDEKLHKTLEERIGQSFALVSKRLEEVYKGLGEMQNLAVGVGDLKKVLSNVKTRGILGEIQLGAILEQILAPEQYQANVTTKKGSRETVEFAIKLPGADDGTVWLPIDAKFPADAYHQLIEAYDSADSQAVAGCAAVLERRVKSFAKDIRDKYLNPPETTDFAIMFLPVEGLYAEVVRMGLVETLQRDYKVNIAGPTTLAALLNSLQMGFKTLAIQKRSGEVWQVLGAVKTEFDKFEKVLSATQQRLEQANSELDKLVGVRTRQIQRRLKGVASLPEAESLQVLDQLAEEGLNGDDSGGDQGAEEE
ncbi:MAG: DNA recombination protein RmuC [Peptococcaceae bacterium]|nr:DNA recombination protein RmuC [Peptococcaceae bacterium]